MALSIAQLAAPVEGTTATLASSSFSPSANALVIVQATVTGNAGANGAMSLSTDFGSLSFTLLGQYGLTNNGSSNVAIWYAQVGGTAPGSGTVTVTYSGTPASGRIAVAEVSGHDQTTPIVGTNGTTASGVSTISTTLTASPTTSDMVIGAVVTRNLNGAGTVGSGFTSLWWGFDASPSATTGLEYQTGTTSTTVDFSGLNTVSSALIAFTVQVASGGGGTNGSVTAVEATATAQAEAPSVSTGSTITGTVATATSGAVAPTLSAGSTVTGAVATATADALAPVVSGGSSAVDGSVAAVLATATADALAPTISAGATVAAVVSTATADAHPPAIGAGAGVTAVPATATADALAPAVDTGGTDATVAGAMATATAEAIAPGVSTITYVLTLGSYNYPAGGDLLWASVYYRPGYSIIKRSGVYTQERFPETDGADVLYLGGHVYTLSPSEYDALAAAGFSSLLTATEVTY